MRRSLRAGLAVLAVLATAWFVVGARQAHELDGASNLIGEQAGNTARASDRTLALLRSADFLLPGNQADLLRAQLALERREYARAKRLIAQATHREPDDTNAWKLALDLAVIDRRAENPGEITAHLRALDPVDARNFGH
jgi:uncharacterized protein HemY